MMASKSANSGGQHPKEEIRMRVGFFKLGKFITLGILIRKVLAIQIREKNNQITKSIDLPNSLTVFIRMETTLENANLNIQVERN